MGPDEIRNRSVVEITKYATPTYDKDVPIIKGLFDQTMVLQTRVKYVKLVVKKIQHVLVILAILN